MVRKNTWYSLLMGVWFFLALGSGLAVVIGYAEPYVSLAEVPYGPPGVFGAMIAVIMLGGIVIGWLKKRSWRAAGRELGVEPTSGSLIGTPTLEGTIRGRTVRLSTYSVSTGGGGRGSSSQTYTLVEAELAQPVERGFFLGPDAGPTNSAETDVPDELRRKRIAGEYYATGEISKEAASRLLTNEVRDAFRAGAGSVVVGDPTDAIMSLMPDGDDAGLLGGAVSSLTESAFRDQEGFEETTVAHTRKGLLLEPELLEPQIDAVVAVAEAYETTDTRPAASGGGTRNPQNPG